jgi:hypothetical protein
MLMGKWLVEQADRFLAITKQRWPNEPSGNPGQLPEKTCSPRCETVTPPVAGDETVTKPGPGDGYKWLFPMVDRLEHGDEMSLSEFGEDGFRVTREPAGMLVMQPFLYRRRIDAAPEPSSGACQLPAKGDGVEGLPTVGWWKGELVSRADAARLIAAARRKAEEARAECERLRLTDAERLLLSTYRRSAERAVKQYGTTSGAYIAEARREAEVVGGLLARHDKGGAA